MSNTYRKIPKINETQIYCPFCNSKLERTFQPVYEYYPNGIDCEKTEILLLRCYKCRINYINQAFLDMYEDSSDFCEIKTFKISYGDTKTSVKYKALGNQVQSIDNYESNNKGIIKENRLPDFKYDYNDIERNLTEDIFKEYDCPPSTIGMVFYEMPKHPKDTLRKAYIVSDRKDEATSKRNSYHKSHPYSKVIFDCLSEKGETFVYQEQLRKLHYFYGNRNFYNIINAYRNISNINNATFDELVDICVYHGKGMCKKHNSQMEIVTAEIIGTRAKEPQELQVYYCPDCNEYYINYQYYREFALKNGIPPLKLFDKYSHTATGDYYSSLNSESILAIYGYHVSGELQNRDKYRQNLLEDLIDMELLSKGQIISHIEWLIKFRPDAYNAQIKWRSDLEHIRNYQKNRQRLVRGVFKAGKNKILK